MPSRMSCTDCMYEEGFAKPISAEHRDGPVITATFKTQCRVCTEEIEEGELIVHTSLQRWVHDDCV